jgi:hypothetical protein
MVAPTLASHRVKTTSAVFRSETSNDAEAAVWTSVSKGLREKLARKCPRGHSLAKFPLFEDALDNSAVVFC